MSGIQPHGSHVVPYSHNHWNAPDPQYYGWPRAQQPAYYPAAHAVPYYQHAGYQIARPPRMIAPPPRPALPRPPPRPALPRPPPRPAALPRPPPEQMGAVVPVERPIVAAPNLNLEELSTLIVKVVEKLLPPAKTQISPCCCKRRCRNRRAAGNPVTRRGRDL